MPVNARRLIRRMRGGAQAHLIEADDGHAYVVKFINNPQHRRVLVNETIGAVFLNYLQIATPSWAIVQISPEFLRENPEVHLQLGNTRRNVTPGWHFGSRYPGDPDRQAVYDFIPDTLLSTVANLPDFLGVLVFDKWTGNADSRQAIFFRARVKEWIAQDQNLHPLRLGFVAQMVDNGFLFEGPHWNFTDSPIQGLYFRPLVYQGVGSLDSFQPWLERMENFPEELVDQAIKQIPPEWLAGEEDAFERLMTRLLARRRRIAELVESSRRGPVSPFPAWT